MKILGFGSLNYDYVYGVDHILMPGETETADTRNIFIGGKGLNQLTALAKAGVSVYMAGCVGEDAKGILEQCNKLKIDTRYIKEVEGASGHTIIQVDKTGQNSILVYGGANRKQCKEHIDSVLEEFGENDIILLQNEINLLDYIIEQAYKKKMTIILNPSPFDEKLKNCDYNKVSMLLINETEDIKLQEKKNQEKYLIV